MTRLVLVAIELLVTASTLYAEGHPTKAFPVLTGYMANGGTVTTGSVALLDECFSPVARVMRAEIEGKWLKVLCDKSEENRRIAIALEFSQLFSGLKPGIYATLIPWSGLRSNESGMYWATALDDGKLCLILPGSITEFPVLEGTRSIQSITPFPQKGVLAAVTLPILGTNAVDGMHPSLEGIDIHTHKVLWSFSTQNNALDVGRLTWINARYLLWTCHARHWAAFEVYDVKRQKVVAKDHQTDRNESEINVSNWRIEGNKVVAYYWGRKSPKVVFDGEK